VHRPSFDAWPQRVQEEMRAAAQDAVIFQRQLHVKEEDEAMAAIRMEGGEILDFPVLEKRPLILALVPQTVGIRCAIISRMMTPTIERLLRDCDCGEIPRRNFLLSLAPLTAALRGMAQSKGRQNFISQIRTGSWSSFSIRAIDPQYRPLLHDRGQVRTRQSSQSAR